MTRGSKLRWLFARGLDIYRSEGPKTLLQYSTNYVERLLMRHSDVYYAHRRARLRAHCDANTDADPLKIIWIDPQAIEYLTGSIESGPTSSHLDHVDPFSPNLDNFGRVAEGEWDQQRDQFSELALYQGIKQRYEAGLDWEATDFYKRHRRRIQTHGESFSCQSEAELREACTKTDELYAHIKDEGYSTQRQLGKTPRDEIVVNIDRDGNVLFNGGGRHRLSIAKVLGLDAVPVVVLVRHTKWQKLREEISQATTREELSETASSHLRHPDMQDIVGKQLQEGH